MAVMFWCTPIFYDLATVHQRLPPWVYGVYIVNPLAGLVDAARKAVLYDHPPDGVASAMAVGVSLLVFAAGVWFFHRYQRHFADRV